MTFRAAPWATVLAVLCAPTVGDVGSCGQEPVDLDPVAFFAVKERIDCQRCGACGLSTGPCKKACAAQYPRSFPPGCRPLVHDGEVCLRALKAASCDETASYMADRDATAPTECQFCPADR